MHQHISMGFVIKVHAVYDRPFWREQGLSGTAFSPYELVARGVRQHQPRRRARHARRLRLRPQRRRRLPPLGRGAQGAHPRVALALLRSRGEEPGRLLRERLGLRGVDARRVRRELRPRRPAPVRRGPAHPGRAHPLRLQRHGRRRLPARRRRDPHGSPRRGEHHRGGPRMSGQHRRRLHRHRCRRRRGRARRAAGRGIRVGTRHRASCCRRTTASVITPPDAGYDRYLAGAGRRRGSPRPRDGIPGCRDRTARTCASATRSPRVSSRPQPSSGRRTSSSAPRTADCRGRHRLGTVATELLHSSTCPWCSRPRARGEIDPATGVTRITAAIGTRPGADALLEESDGARRRHRRRAAPALARVGRPAGRASTPASSASPVPRTPTTCSPRRSHALPDGIDAEVVVARGDSIEDAVAAPQLGARRARRRRLQPPRPAAAALPRLDRSEDAARTPGPDDRGAPHTRARKESSR